MVCKQCGNSKNNNEFLFAKRYKGGIYPYCISCRAEAGKLYREKNKEKIKHKSQLYYIENSKTIIEKSAKYVANNPDKLKLRCKNYRDVNKEKIKQTQKKYSEKNRDVLLLKAKANNIKNKEKRRLYYANRRKVDSLYKLSLVLKDRIRKGIIYYNSIKLNTTKELLGCDYKYAHVHLQNKFSSGMNWENYGEWEIDHIIPLASAKNNEELKLLFNYNNLQPLWKDENRSKSDKY